MRQETRTIRKFEELTPPEQERAIEHYRNKYADMLPEVHILADNLHNEFENVGGLGTCSGPHSKNRQDFTMCFDLSYSQGQGVSVTGRLYDLDFLKKTHKGMLEHDWSKAKLGDEPISDLIDKQAILIRCFDKVMALSSGVCIDIEGKDHRYGHSSAVEVEADNNIDDEAEDYDAQVEAFDSLVAELRCIAQDYVDDLMSGLESAGYAEIEYAQSAEAIREDMIANEHEFDEDGDMI